MGQVSKNMQEQGVGGKEWILEYWSKYYSPNRTREQIQL